MLEDHQIGMRTNNMMVSFVWGIPQYVAYVTYFLHNNSVAMGFV